MVLSFSDIRYKLSTEFGINYEACPVGAHYVHGKIERKIKEVKRSITKTVENRRLSLMQWETLGQQIANSINNLPIGLGNKVASLENVDLITPNRLLLGRNNNRATTKPLILSTDAKKIIQTTPGDLVPPASLCAISRKSTDTVKKRRDLPAGPKNWVRPSRSPNAAR